MQKNHEATARGAAKDAFKSTRQKVNAIEWKQCALEPEYGGCNVTFPAEPWHKRYCSKDHQQAKYHGGKKC